MTYALRPLLALAAASMLAGCTVGPDYQMPSLSLPDSWFAANKAQLPAKDAAIEQRWWQHFNDPVLAQLIDKAVADNLDLKVAESRIAEARAARSGAQAGLLPTVNASATPTRQANRFTFGDGGAELAKPFNTFQAGFDASWELDIFGGQKRAIEAQTAELAAAEATRDDLRVSLLAEVARTYIDIRQYQSQLAVTADTIQAAQRIADIAGERFHVGKTSELDLTQARAQLAQLRTQLPYYQNLLAQSEYSMDVLMGEQPGYTHGIVSAKKPVPVTDKDVVLAAPSQVIANRPDIRVAERRLASATAQQGVAIAKLFPDISLSAFVGLLNVDLGNLVQSSSKSWSIGGNALLPVLNYGHIEADIKAADARQQAAYDTYRKTVISALSDVARSVTAYQKQEEFQTAMDKTVQENRAAANIANERYKGGLSTFIDVLDAQRTLYSSQSQQAQARADTSRSLVSVYKSLGGGWQPVAEAGQATP